MSDPRSTLLRLGGFGFFGAITASLSHEMNNVLATVNELGGLLGEEEVHLEGIAILDHAELVSRFQLPPHPATRLAGMERVQQVRAPTCVVVDPFRIGDQSIDRFHVSGTHRPHKRILQQQQPVTAIGRSADGGPPAGPMPPSHSHRISIRIPMGEKR